MKRVLMLLCCCVSVSVWAADWSKPSITDTYSNYTSYMTARDTDVVKGLDPATTSPTNVPTNAIRWNSASNKWQKYNGTTWGDLAGTFAINVSTVGGYSPGNGVNDLLILDGAGLVPLADIPTVLSGKSADMLDGIDASSFARVDAATTFTQAVGSSRSCAAGYERTGVNSCIKNNFALSGLVVGTNSIVAPAATAKTVQVFIRCSALTSGAAAYRYAITHGYGDSGLTLYQGMVPAAGYEGAGRGVYETVALTAGTLSIKLSSPGSLFYLVLDRDSGNNGSCQFALAGYSD